MNRVNSMTTATATPDSTDNSRRWKIVGWDHNAPDPFPGFGGKVGMGQDMALLDDGSWFVVFHAGYWHLSVATPMIASPDMVQAWEKNGYPKDHVAPQGGRVLSMRSDDEGRTWTRPTTVLQDRWDVSPIGMNRLHDGSLLLFVNQQASWYGDITPPPDHLEVNTRIGVMRSTDQGLSWTKPTWLDMPQRHYQRAYAQAIVLADGTLLYPTYTTETFDGTLNGAIHRSTDNGITWQLLSTLTRDKGQPIDEPTLTALADGRVMLMTRLDAAIFYSEDQGHTWSFSHCAPFAPLKAHRTAVLHDGTVVCWMTSHGRLRVSWSSDHGRTWQVDEHGQPLPLDLNSYGYPGGCVLTDESIVAVYYDAANQQQRTHVWATRFSISPDRKKLIQHNAPVIANNEPTLPNVSGELDVDVMHTQPQ